MLGFTVQPHDFSLLQQDRYTFSVLSRILHEPYDLFVTDHETFLLCHSRAPYPVWLWTKDGISESDKEEAYQAVQKYRPINGGHSYNLKYELAEFFIQKAQEEGLAVRIVTNLLAYDCPSPQPPKSDADGFLHVCQKEDAQEAAAILPGYYTEIGDEPPSAEECLQKATAYIDRGAFFFWKDKEGYTTSCCSYKENEGTACLGRVFTLPQFRRRHYAEHLVYAVTCRAKEKGLIPMLYTDADYPASNACYQKIGYEQKGCLCTIGINA